MEARGAGRGVGRGPLWEDGEQAGLWGGGGACRLHSEEHVRACVQEGAAPVGGLEDDDAHERQQARPVPAVRLLS
jgi:hypothetical protein